MKVEVGKRMRDCRLSCKLTQSQVAKRLGIAQSAYNRFERGQYECTYEQLANICRIFDVSSDYLLGLADF